MLVVAAAPEELGDIEGVVVGVGPVVAAANAARILAERKPEAVVMIGTAGVYAGGGAAIGEAIVAEEIGLSWGVAAMGLGYVPRPPKPIAADADLLESLELPRHRVLTAGAITTDLTLADRLADGFTVEHLECYSVAFACKEAGVPFIAVLGIANEVGPDAHVQWLANRDAAQEAARVAIRGLAGR